MGEYMSIGSQMILVMLHMDQLLLIILLPLVYLIDIINLNFN